MGHLTHLLSLLDCSAAVLQQDDEVLVGPRKEAIPGQYIHSQHRFVFAARACGVVVTALNSPCRAPTDFAIIRKRAAVTVEGDP
jgi:hypothetical protein